MAPSRETEELVCGILTAADWSECGNVTGLKIEASGELEYYVDPDAIGTLLAYLSDYVEVYGFTSNYPSPRITVTRIRKITALR